MVTHRVLRVYSNGKRKAFIKSYETKVMIHKTNASYSPQTPVLVEKAPKSTVNNIMKMNSAAINSGTSRAICSNVLTFHAKRILRDKKLLPF
jgi:hypothetical protein